MYKTKTIPGKILKTIQIANQDEIKELTGSKLELDKAWELIKNRSENFTKEDLKVKEADQLLYQIVYPSKTKTSESNRELIIIKEKERARALVLLELELELLNAA